MTQKVMVVLDGKKEGKAQFDKIVKDAGYWIWNVNPLNVLVMVSHKLGWNKEKDKAFYDYLEEFRELVNRRNNFEEKYVASMIDKLEESTSTHAIIFHSLSSAVKEKLKTKEFCYRFLINDGEERSDYDKTFAMDKNFEQNILEAMKEITGGING